MSLHDETARLLALADAATPGPWTWGNNDCGLYGSGQDNEVLTWQRYGWMWLAYGPYKNGNRALIAAAHDMAAHIRALDARVRELEAAMPEYRNARMNVSSLRDAGPTELRGRVTRREG